MSVSTSVPDHVNDEPVRPVEYFKERLVSDSRGRIVKIKEKVVLSDDLPGGFLRSGDVKYRGVALCVSHGKPAVRMEFPFPEDTKSLRAAFDTFDAVSAKAFQDTIQAEIDKNRILPARGVSRRK